MPELSLSALAIPGVSVLIAFLGYTSQFLFYKIEPRPLDGRQAIVFNALLLCVWICYTRACLTDPGRIPRHWSSSSTFAEVSLDSEPSEANARQRWCRKCELVKPPRAHHCKVCKRCIPKMDHHCPWTGNCVSHLTYPHFIRFLFYAVTAMIYLEYFLSVRVGLIWEKRDLPSYLGPSTSMLALLLVLLLANSFTLFAISILLIRSLWSLGVNTSTIEGWEIERHRALLRRARVLGGSLDGPDGVQIKITRQEFPYDIGILQNIRQGMGGSNNILTWFWPFSVTPSLSSGLAFEVNGIEDPSLPWPPPDPDRIARPTISYQSQNAFIHSERQFSEQEELDAFRERQQEDMKRWQQSNPRTYRRQPFRKRHGPKKAYKDDGDGEQEPASSSSSGGEERWRNSEGERLADFGVDEDAEFYDEDDVPLAVLLRRRKEGASFSTGVH